MEQNSEYLWLKQSATVIINGQTRTIEIAVPLRPGATADEVEALLSEADAGMERLGRHLDARVAALTDPAAPPAATARLAMSTAAPPAAPPEASAPPEAPARPAATPVEAPARPATLPAPSERAPAEQPPARTPPPATPSQPAPAISPRPPVSSRPATPTPAPASPRPATPASTPAPTSAQTELTRPEFIAALKDIALDVRQAMQKLGVRSLEGLNLREALEALRRQSLRNGRGEAAAPTIEPTPDRPASSVPPRSTPARNAPAPAAPPRYFEEEDEPDVEFSVAGSDDAEETEEGEEGDELPPYEESAPNEWDADDDDLDDVPDFGPPPGSHRGPASGRAPHPAPRPTPAPPVDDAAPPTSSGDPAVADLLARLRAAQGGGTPSSQQRTAYRNIIVNEIGEDKATYLIRGIWRVTPERLGPEQMDELLSWGKQDTFSEDANKLVERLRAERAAEESGSSTARPAPRTKTRPLATSDPSGGA
jgi:ribosomal protein L12E/L44/L45/RPP1/RPP2